MTMRGDYAPMLPEFDAFLFAPVGEEVNGVPLSVLSALARLGLDPWDEAGRLAHLTKEAATDQLARLIGSLNDRRWSTTEAWRIASGLVARLPIATDCARANGVGAARITKPTMLLGSPLNLIYLAMAVAIVVSFIASGHSSFGW
jgi:hypothetical protein